MRAGDLVGDRFDIIDQVAAGGMGTIWRARDRDSGRFVAVKVLIGGELDDRTRFEREARVLAALVHPGVVRYVAHGQTADGQPYLVEDWIDGETLADRLEQVGLTAAESVVLLGQAAAAVAAAHAVGVVHRDLKPDNLLLRDGDVGRVTLIDFGLARPLREGPRLTRTGVVMGTPGYLAPEQALGSTRIDARADVFALGCILYECLTGRTPFAGQDARAVMAKVLLVEVPPPSSLAPEVPAAVDQLVAAMLDKRPERRPADAGEVAAALAAAPAPGPGPRRASGESGPPTLRVPAPAPAPVRTLAIVLAARTPRSRSAGERLARALDDVGGRLQPMDDGSLLVSIAGGELGEAAARAARAALHLQEQVGSSAIAVTTVNASQYARGGDVAGDLVDRCARQLDGTEAAAISIDGATAGWIDGSFAVVSTPGGFRLRVG